MVVVVILKENVSVLKLMIVLLIRGVFVERMEILTRINVILTSRLVKNKCSLKLLNLELVVRFCGKYLRNSQLIWLDLSYGERLSNKTIVQNGNSL